MASDGVVTPSGCLPKQREKMGEQTKSKLKFANVQFYLYWF
jgi:hypothetical protein